MIKTDRKGFTLVELLAVIVILAIIMIIATMNVGKVITRSRTQSFESNMNLAVKNAKRILDTGDTLTTEKLRQSLGYSANEYDFDVAKVSDGYVLRLISNSTGKFKNVDFSTISCVSKDYLCEENADNTPGRNIIGLKISTDGNTEKITEGSTEDKIVKDTIVNGCKDVEKKAASEYEIGDEISFCNKDVVYDHYGTLKRGKSEDFNVISKDDDTITMLAQHNLIETDNPQTYEIVFNGFQALINNYGKYPIYLVKFGDYNNNKSYWVNERYDLLEKYGTSYPANVYDEKSLLYEKVNNYVNKLKETFGKINVEGRLITYDELISLGCKSTSPLKCNTYDWINATYYWTGSAKSFYGVYYVGGMDSKEISSSVPSSIMKAGLRPVITISKSEL